MTVNYLVIDAITVPSKRTKTTDGYLVIKDAVIARTGIQLYRAFELGLHRDAYAPMSMIRVYRPPEEVFSARSMSSFENAPLTINHPPAGVTAANWQALAKGEARNIRRVGDKLVADLWVKAKDGIDAVEGGKTALSNGYLSDIELVSGSTPTGEPYDAVQRNIVGNHVAIVDKARCGSVCRISDFLDDDTGDKKMAATDATRKLVVDNIPIEVNDTAAAVVEKLQAEVKNLTQMLTDAKAKLGTVVSISVGDKVQSYTSEELAKLLADKDAELATLKTQVMTPDARDALVQEWVELLKDAEALDPKMETKGKTCEAIRREMVKVGATKDAAVKGVVDAILAPTGKTIETVDGVTVKTAFTAMKGLLGQKKLDAAPARPSGNIGDAFIRDSGDQPPKLVGRAAMMAQDAARFSTVQKQ